MPIGGEFARRLIPFVCDPCGDACGVKQRIVGRLGLGGDDFRHYRISRLVGGAIPFVRGFVPHAFYYAAEFSPRQARKG